MHIRPITIILIHRQQSKLVHKYYFSFLHAVLYIKLFPHFYSSPMPNYKKWYVVWKGLAIFSNFLFLFRFLFYSILQKKCSCSSSSHRHLPYMPKHHKKNQSNTTYVYCIFFLFKVKQQWKQVSSFPSYFSHFWTWNIAAVGKQLVLAHV